MPTVDGIVSGIDTTALIKGIVGVQQATVTAMKAQQSDFESQRESVAGVNNRLTTLRDAIRKYDTPLEIASFMVTGAPSRVTVTAGVGTRSGSYAIRVDKLATAQTSITQGVADRAAKTLATGDLAVTVGGVPTTVTLDADNASLDGLAAALDATAGLSAFVLDTGAAGAARYQLVVQGAGTGAASTVTFDTSGLAGGTVPAFTEEVAAEDAIVEIAGISVRSATNTLTGVIPGLTLVLGSPGAVETVTIAPDTAGTRAKLQEVVDAWNAALTYYDGQSAYNATEGIKGPLVGEATTRRAMEDLGGMISSPYTVAGTSLTALSMLGVKTGQDGKLTLDAAVFDAAYVADPTGVELLLTADEGPLGALADRLDAIYVDAENGALVARTEGLQSTIEDLDLQIEKAQERVEAQAKLLRTQFNAMEVALGRLKSTQAFLTSFFASNSSSDS